MTIIANTIEFHTDNPQHEPFKYQWTGDGDLEFDDKTFKGIGNVLTVSPATSSISQPTNRMTVQFTLADESIAQRIVRVSDALPITTEWIMSNDSGMNWKTTGLKYTGRLSAPKFQNGIYTVELETYRGSSQKGPQMWWSEQSQLSRHPGDRCFEYLRRLELGQQSNWG